MRTDLAGPSQDVYDTDEGFELGMMSLAPDPNPGDVDLLFEEYDCLAGATSLFEIDQVNTV
jgi:hypothetical protein